MDCIRDDIIFQAHLKQWADNAYSHEDEGDDRISVVKKIYGSFESLPKPSTPKQANQILHIIDIWLKSTMMNYDNHIVTKKNEFNLDQLFFIIANNMRLYIHDETNVDEALNMVVTLMKKNNEQIESIVFNEKKLRLRDLKETTAKSDENANLTLIDIFHTMNILAKNTFDKIHDAHRVKRLFKT